MKSKFKDIYLFSVGFFVLGLKNAAGKDSVEDEYDDTEDDLSCCPSTQLFFRNLISPISGRGISIEAKKNQAPIYSMFHWESVIFVQKVSLCFLAVFFTDSHLEMQLATVFCVMIIFTYLNLLNRPYNLRSLNKLNALG